MVKLHKAVKSADINGKRSFSSGGPLPLPDEKLRFPLMSALLKVLCNLSTQTVPCNRTITIREFHTSTFVRSLLCRDLLKLLVA